MAWFIKSNIPLPNSLKGKYFWNTLCWGKNTLLTIIVLFLKCSQWPWMEFGALKGISLWEAWYQDSRAETVHSHKPSTIQGMEGWEVRPLFPWLPQAPWGTAQLANRWHTTKTLSPKTASLPCFCQVTFYLPALSTWDSRSSAKKHTSTDSRVHI